MLNPFQNCLRSSAVAGLTALCLVIALAAPRALAKDGDSDRDEWRGAEMSRLEQRGER